MWVSMQADFRRMYPVRSAGGFLFGNLTPVISIARTHGALRGVGAAVVAAGLQRELRGAWGPLRLAASYVLYYGALSQRLLPLVARFVVRWRAATPVPVPQLTLSNIGLIADAAEGAPAASSRPPLWSRADVARMPPLQSFFGSVTEPVFFRHVVLGSFSFLGRVGLSANFSRFAMTREEATRFLARVRDRLIQAAAP